MKTAAYLRTWWAWGLRGVAAFAFGGVGFALAPETLEGVVVVLGAYLLADGILTSLVGVLAATNRWPWWTPLGLSVLDLAVALGILVSPDGSALLWPAPAVIWAGLAGVLQFLWAVQLRREIGGGWVLALSGVLSVALGALLALFPVAGVVPIAWTIGTYGALTGLVMLRLASGLRRARELPDRPAGPSTGRESRIASV